MRAHKSTTSTHDAKEGAARARKRDAAALFTFTTPTRTARTPHLPHRRDERKGRSDGKPHRPSAQSIEEHCRPRNIKKTIPPLPQKKETKQHNFKNKIKMPLANKAEGNPSATMQLLRTNRPPTINK
jgi:hypothetical protein